MRLATYIPTRNSFVFAGGYPGRGSVDALFWQWQLNPGTIADKEQGKLQTQDLLSFSDGYDIIYSSITYGGMSGGAIFDTEGRVIGIHGKAEGDTSAVQKIILGNSLGISIQTFTGAAAKLNVNPSLLKVSENPLPDLKEGDKQTVIAVRTNISPPGTGASAEQWLQYGNQLYRIEEYNNAVIAFDKAIERDRAYILLGNYGKALALGLDKNYPQALTAIKIAIANLPSSKHYSYYYLWNVQSFIYRQMQQHELALQSINSAINLEPKDLRLLNQKAVIFTDKKQDREAVFIYDLIIATQPQSYL